MVPSLSVSCMLNRTIKKETVLYQFCCDFMVQLTGILSPSILVSRECFEYHVCMPLQRSLSLLISSLCSSVIWWAGALKYDMTVRNSSKPISSTDPLPSFWKFLWRTSGDSNVLLLYINSFAEPWILNFTISLQVCGLQMILTHGTWKKHTLNKLHNVDLHIANVNIYFLKKTKINCLFFKVECIQSVHYN